MKILMNLMVKKKRKDSFCFSSTDFLLFFLAELHQNVPKEMRRFIRRGSATLNVDDLLNLTRWSSSLSSLSDSAIENPIHLIVQWYFEENQRRRLELISVLHVNVRNPAISKIHFIQNTQNCTIFNDLQDDQSFPLDLFRSKLILKYNENVDPNQRLTISQVFHYSNDQNLKGYVILSNLDVIFDHSLFLLRNRILFSHQTIFYLSRYEIDPTISTLGLQCSDQHYAGSHDALIFQKPISDSIINELPFEIGTWNIEVKIISIFLENQYEVKNPCKSIRIWHYHSSQIRHRLMPSKKYIPDRFLSVIMRPPEYLS